MRVEVIAASELDPALERRWEALQDANENLVSPFFTPGFTRAVARQRQDARLAVIEAEGRICGFLPFHRRPGGRAAPVGGQICDYQGVIGAAPAAGARGEALLRGAGIACYDFDHGLADDPLMARNAFAWSRSPRADLREGLEGWRKAVAAQTSQLAGLRRKARKAERALGELRLVFDDPAPAAWDKFVRWKDRALREKGLAGFPGAPWVGALLEDVRSTQSARFAGVFTTLYAGDRMIAAHFGMRSHRALHWWFPAYDAEAGRYSPGLILLVRLIEAAAGRGVEEVDFGRGDERYKREFATAARALCQGSLERPATGFGTLPAMRKAVQRLANRTLPERAADVLRRAGTKALRAGLI